MAVTTDSDDAPSTLSLTAPAATNRAESPGAPADAAAGTGGMAWPPEVLPSVLPTERLNAKGMPQPELRAAFRRIPNVRNAFNVVSVWAQSFGLIALVCWATPQLPLFAAVPIWAATFVLMGRAFALYAILGHEAAHKLLFSKKKLNDVVGRHGVLWFREPLLLLRHQAEGRSG